MSTEAEKDAWVLVRDESELRKGMAVQLRPCAVCGRKETIILTARRNSPSPFSQLKGVGIVMANTPYVWLGPGSCCAEGGHLGNAIIDRRLYRLADSQLADLSESTTATRERELAR